MIGVSGDNGARLAIRDDHSRSFTVEAGAGTGKTTALVGRVVSLIAAGEKIQHIAAITFTDAAAAELRDRVRLALEAAVSEDDGSTTSTVERDLCREALEHLDDASISTLHGFAQRILAAHPLEAGLPPTFDVVDETEAAIELDGRWGDFEASLLDDVSLEATLLTAHALGIRLESLRDIAEELHRKLERLGGAKIHERPLPRIDGARGVLACIDDAVARVDECSDPDDKLAVHLAGLVEYRDDLRRAVETAGGQEVPLEVLELLAGGPKLASTGGQKGSWGGHADDVRSLCRRAEGARSAFVDAARTAVLHTLGARAVAFVRDYAADRRSDGRLEFQDLLVLAVEVLRDNPDVLAAARDHYRILLIDEFQDTDPLQVDLALLLSSSEPPVRDRPPTGAGIEAGRLFLVGDPKQSIYRFRRADLEVYAAAAGREDLEKLSLTCNFRSVPGILTFVNEVFEHLLEGAESGVQATHVDLEPSRSATEGVALPVRVIGGLHEGKIGPIREREASEIAALIGRMKRERWKVRDGSEGHLRDAELCDVAILLPTRTSLGTVEDALEAAGIPARVESQSLVFATAEIHDLLVTLGAVDDPTDEVALVGALRSPAFGCSDADLVDFHLAGGRWSYLAPCPRNLAETHPVVGAMRSLRSLHEQRSWRGVSATLDALVSERGLLPLALAHRRPRDHWRRIRFLVDRARAFDDRGGSGLRDFVEWIRRQAEQGARAVEVVAPETDDDAVRILTVHGAKGLEFPIVVLAGLNSAPRNETPAVLWSESGPELSIACRGTKRFSTTGYAVAQAVEQRHADAERIRLLYVAATRACDHLVVSLHRANDKCLAGSLAAALDGATYEAVEAVHGVEPAVESRSPAPDLTLAGRDEILTARAERLSVAARPSAVAATTLAKLAAESAGADAPEESGRYPGLEKNEADTADDLPAWRRGRAGTAVGRAVHAVLQTIDLATGEGVVPAARTQALAEGIPDREGEVRRLAEHVLAAPIVRTAAAAGRYWREVPVAAAVGDRVLEGFVDLLVETPDGMVVVDYKTDQVGDEEEIERAMSRYSVQGAAYAVALTDGSGLAVSRCVFVFAQPSGAIEREIRDLAAAMQQARDALERAWL